jgi:hypothetical protein
VSGFPIEFEGRVGVRLWEHLEPQAAALVAQRHFDSHGMVVRFRGSDLYVARDHRANAGDARSTIVRALRG